MQINNSNLRRSRSPLGRPLFAILFLLVSFTFSAMALQSITLTWDPSPDADVIGYNIYFGTQSGNYTNKVSAGNSTTVTISNLVEGVTYYFAATAYNTSGLESDPSNEISYTVPGGPNATPTLDLINNLAIQEDGGARAVALTGIGSGSAAETQTLTLTATSSNPSLIPAPTVTYISPNSTASITINPVTNLFGSAVITVSVNDGQASNNIISRTFTVTVNPVNDLPTLSTLANLTLNEDAGAQTVSLSGISTGATNETQTLAITATSSNPTLIPTPTITYSSPATTGTLRFTPAANLSGSAVITVTVNDGQGSNNIVSRTFTVTVNHINDPPTLNTLANLTINEDSTLQTVALTGITTGATNEAQTLTVTAVSSNPSLIPAPSVSYTSPATTGSLTFTPVTNAFGSAIITVTVNDGQAASNTISRTFTVTVNAINDAPTLNVLSNLTINQNSGAQIVSLSGISSGVTNEAQTLTITATSSNPTLIPNPSITYTSPNATGTLTFTPAANLSGSAVITVAVNDGQTSNNSISRTFTVTVNATTAAPGLNTPADVTINEDAAQQTVALSGISSGVTNSSPTITITAASSNPSLIPTPTVVYTSPGATGSLKFTPTVNLFGSAIITVTVNNGLASNNITSRTFTVTVNPVNDTPTLNSLANVSINEDAGVQTVSLTGISTGATNEIQALTVTASSSNPALIPTPTVAYTSPNSTGSLSFAPASNLSGSAVITVTVNDGQASSNVISRTFTVTVNPVNDVPTLDPLADLSISEDAGLQTVSLRGISTGATNETQTLTITASSSNPTLIPNPSITYTSPNSSGSMTFTPGANTSGSAVITVNVNDGQAANNLISRTFTVTVIPVNDAPTLNGLTNVVINENSGAQSIVLQGISSGATDEVQNLTVTATSSNPALIPNPTVSYTSPNTTGSASFTPAANLAGSALITVTVDDGQATNNLVSRTFTITVNPVNTPPTLDTLSDLVIEEDAGQQIAPLTGITSGAGGETDTLTITAISSNPGLIPNPTVTYAAPGSTGSLSFTALTNAFGLATITVTINDGQASNNILNRSFTVTVNPVNDPPSLDAIADRAVTRDAGTQTVTLTGITSGATNEVDTLSILAT